VYVALSLLAALGGLAAWGLVAVGLRGAYRAVRPSDQKIIKRVARVGLPAVLGAVLLFIALYALISHLVELSQLGRFLLWEGLGVGLLLPVAVVLGRYARRLKRPDGVGSEQRAAAGNEGR
jgi:hypothetical protein